LENNIYRAPESSLESENEDICNNELWNPDVAGAWSLLFTPIFGSILVYKNWMAMGEEERAKKLKIWIYISVPMALLSVVFGLFGFVYICVWYFSSQKKQTKYLKEKYSGIYPKKGWLKPICIALLSWLGVVVTGVLAISFLAAW